MYNPVVHSVCLEGNCLEKVIVIGGGASGMAAAIAAAECGDRVLLL